MQLGYQPLDVLGGERSPAPASSARAWSARAGAPGAGASGAAAGGAPARGQWAEAINRYTQASQAGTQAAEGARVDRVLDDEGDRP